MQSYSQRIALALLLAAAVWGAAAAWAARWTTDDAFISFRYAQNLVEGRGLVYNEGERVEGYTNPLWTLWVAAGLALGGEAETWADVWGVAAYVGSILLLGLNGRRAAQSSGPSGRWLPLAALAAALHRDWNVWATGGLETSAFTFLLLAGWTLAVWNPGRPFLLDLHFRGIPRSAVNHSCS